MTVKSRPTGKYMLCPFSPMRHPKPLCLPIMQREVCFIRCQCGGNLFFPPNWQTSEGFTAEQARKLGYEVLVIMNPIPSSLPPVAARPPLPLPPRKKIK